MFEKLKQRILTLPSGPSPFDPSGFGDPVAVQTAWTPAKQGGANFRTHKLITTGPSRVEFRAAVGAILFYALFFLAGLGVLIFLIVGMFKSGAFSFRMTTIIPLLVSCVFVAAGSLMLYTGTTPLVFDRGRGVFWKGRKGPDQAMDNRTEGRFVRLENVHALQLISEYCRGDKSSYYSYELNLVLHDGTRVNVIDHGNREKIREDARSLSNFLGKPLWDGITH